MKPSVGIIYFRLFSQNCDDEPAWLCLANIIYLFI